jgi:hypothetical protein
MTEEQRFIKDKLFYDALVDKGNGLASGATPEQLVYLAKARQALVETRPERYESPTILPGTNPFLYCRMRRYSSGGVSGHTSTSELGTLYNNTSSAPKLFKNFTGGNDSHYDSYVIPPTIQFVGSNARWLKGQGWLEYVASSNQYSYSSYDMILMFIRNSTGNSLTRTFYQYFTANGSNSSYNYSSAYVGTPNATNGSSNSISSVSWATVYNYGGGT